MRGRPRQQTLKLKPTITEMEFAKLLSSSGAWASNQKDSLSFSPAGEKVPKGRMRGRPRQ